MHVTTLLPPGGIARSSHLLGHSSRPAHAHRSVSERVKHVNGSQHISRSIDHKRMEPWSLVWPGTTHFSSPMCLALKVSRARISFVIYSVVDSPLMFTRVFTSVVLSLSGFI